MTLKFIGLVAISSQLLSGCAQMTHLTRTRQLGQSGFILIDAKQRAISSYNNVNCAEPSPDALSALAASQGLNVATPQGASLGQSFALAESAASIGLRTQSIQLLRDFMFRVCEGYQAGKISPFMVELLHRRFQTTVVAVLAIEQLTGAMRAPAVVLGGSAAVGNADAIVKLSASRETQAAQVEVAQKDLADKTAKADAADQEAASKRAAFDAAEEGDAKAAAKTAWEAAQKTATDANEAKSSADLALTTRKATLAAIDRALTLAQATGSATSGGAIETGTHQPGDVAAVADAVEKIVKGTYDQKNGSDFCITLLANAAMKGTEVDPRSPVIPACVKMLSENQAIYTAVE